MNKLICLASGAAWLFAATIHAEDAFEANPGYLKLVKVNDGHANVAIFANMPTDDAIAGIVISVSEKEEAVFINIVGNVALESIARLGKQLNLPQLAMVGKVLEES